MARKFIISTRGELRMGNVAWHKDLVEKGEHGCYGGGYWSVDDERKEVRLYDLSGDFGMPDFDELKFMGDYPLDLNITGYTIRYYDFMNEVTFEKNINDLGCLCEY